uniref:Uncharacterized protein n=1 Tax=Brassica oleracea var. oleracea TaxID=109376 RepID=A0A0D3AX94_BRAOL
MYSRIRLAANKTFSTTSVSRRVSSRASTDTSSLSHHNSLEEILRKNGPRLSVPSLLQQRVDSGHAVTLPELRFITNRLIKSNRHDLALQVRKCLMLRIFEDKSGVSLHSPGVGASSWWFLHV